MFVVFVPPGDKTGVDVGEKNKCPLVKAGEDVTERLIVPEKPKKL
jgi:hypothetical protein